MRAAVLFTLVAASCVSAAPGKDKDPPNPHPLVGEWEIVTVTTLGKTRPDVIGGFHIFTADGQWSTKQKPDGDKSPWQQYRVDDKADPKTLDLLMPANKGKDNTWRLLYRVEGDTLTLCQLGEDHTIRPKEFEAGKGSKNVIQTLKKVTPKKK
jgi:uncharacterized protein (TIGR03067 family)